MADETTPVTRRGLLRASAGATAATVGATGSAAASESGGSGTSTIEVGPGGRNVFSPDQAYVTPGTEVEFVWKSDGHNVVPTSQPDGANWEGVSTVENTGHTHTHTFETLGVYDYICEPHESLGMVGSIEVTENPPENTGYQSILPDAAKTLGVATIGAMSSVLGLAYFFMKYGGDYGESEE